MSRDSDTYDVVIVGGGMIGSSLALALAPLPLRIAVVETVARKGILQPSFDDRSTALSRSTQRMFEAMGLWAEVLAASTPISSVHVSDKGRFGFSHIDAEEQGVEALGHVVINRVLGEVLQTHLDTTSNVDLFCPASVTGIDPERGGASATLTVDGKEKTLNCRLLVAADGASSMTREMMGISTQKRDYEQTAIIGNLLTENALSGRAFERFTNNGPLAILPVADGRAGFVWTVSKADADRVLDLDDDAFLAAIQEEFGYRVGRFSRVGKRNAYPLMLTKALRLTATRSVLIGNSAHGLHPVSAQGFNLGMRDVAALCDCVADALDESTDPGTAAVLDRYSDWRRSDHKKLVQFTDSLVRLFVSERPGVGALRNIGMIGFDLIPGVRRTFAKHTMGLAGNLPRLSRGVPVR